MASATADTPASPSGDDMSNKSKLQFNKFIHAARDQEGRGKFEDALALYSEALVLMPDHPKLPKKIKNLKAKISFIKALTKLDDTWRQDPESLDVILDAALSPQYNMTNAIYEKLWPHQREGVSWMWSLFKKASGGILGDDMGLGKTIQVSAFLHGLFHSQLIDKALIIMPLSLMSNWESELAKWCPRKRVRLFHGTPANRERALLEVFEKSGVILTTYETAQSAIESLSLDGTEVVKWDVIVLDEGHRIKDPSKKTSRAISTLQATSKFVLSGTPILNNLKELWALLNYACDGQLLGDMKVFKKEFEEPITRGQMRDASEYEKQKGIAVTNKLRSLIEPHFLRRLKSDIQNKDGAKNKDANASNRNENVQNSPAMSRASSDASTGSKSSQSTHIEDQSRTQDRAATKDDSLGDELALSLGGLTIARPSPKKVAKSPSKPSLNVKKNDLVCWIPIQPIQLALYTEFLISQRDRINEAIATTGTALSAIRVLRQLTNHPQLLRTDGDDVKAFPNFDLEKMASEAVTNVAHQSGKLVFLLELLKQLKKGGHRVLIFSQSVKMLDLIEKALDSTSERWKRLRMDGSINKVAERKALVDEYNTNREVFLFLMTTQVGGVGITLTSADRVVIFDPAWNTAMDDQAADRVYRIGQTKDVVIYRLISSGTIEEKMYRKQVFKGALSKSLLGKEATMHSYFTRGEMRELFTFDPSDIKDCHTQQLLVSLHSHKRDSYPALEKELDYIRKLTSIVGISDHNLLYTDDGEALKSDQQMEERATHASQLLQKTVIPKDVLESESQEAIRKRAGEKGPIGTIQVAEGHRQRRDLGQMGHRVDGITLLTRDEVFEAGLHPTTQSKLRQPPFNKTKPKSSGVVTLPVVHRAADKRPPAPATKPTSPAQTPSQTISGRSANTKTSPAASPVAPVVIKKAASVLPAPNPSTKSQEKKDTKEEPISVEAEEEIALLLKQVNVDTGLPPASSSAKPAAYSSTKPVSSTTTTLTQPPSTSVKPSPFVKPNSRRIIEEDDDDGAPSPSPSLSISPATTPTPIVEPTKPSEAAPEASKGISSSPEPSTPTLEDTPLVHSTATDATSSTVSASQVSERPDGPISDDSFEIVTLSPQRSFAIPKMSRKSIISFDVNPTEDVAEEFVVDVAAMDQAKSSSEAVQVVSVNDDEEDIEEDEEDEESMEDEGASDECSEASESEFAIENQDATSKHYVTSTGNDTEDEEEATAETLHDDMSEEDEEEEEEDVRTNSSFIAPEDDDVVDLDEHALVVARLIQEIPEVTIAPEPKKEAPAKEQKVHVAKSRRIILEDDDDE